MRVRLLIGSSLVLLACKAALPIADLMLSATTIACVMTSRETDPNLLTKFCGAEKDAAPLIHNLIVQREGASRVGVKWPDAGPPIEIAADAGAH